MLSIIQKWIVQGHWLCIERKPQCPNPIHKNGALFLKNMLHMDFKGKTVEDGECISLGNKQLKFIHAPYWHWPDTMFTYLEEDRVLFPCDGFATHFCDERFLTTGWTTYSVISGIITSTSWVLTGRRYSRQSKRLKA